MIKAILRNIKTNITQYVDYFDVNTQIVSAVTVSNIIKNTGLDGEWTIKPNGVMVNAFEKTVRDNHDGDDIATKTCMCITHDFVGGTAETDCFYGEDEVVHSLKAVQVNAGIFKTKDSAKEKIHDTKTDNAILIYIVSADNADRSDKRGTGSKHDYWTNWKIGVLVKIKSKDIEEIGCSDADKTFISSILGVKTKTSSWLKFEKIVGRSTVGQSQVVEYLFSYEDFMDLDDTIADRVRAFSKADYLIKT